MGKRRAKQITLYHGTHAQNLASIKQKGLIPKEYGEFNATLASLYKEVFKHVKNVPRSSLVVLEFKIPGRDRKEYLVPGFYSRTFHDKHLNYGLRQELPPKYLVKIHRMKKRI